MITLNLDDTVLERAASPATTLERAGKLLELGFGQRHPGDGGHGLAPAPLALPADPSDTVAFRNNRLFTDTGIQRMAAIGAMPSGIGGKYQPTKA